jgi:hypothetical protein
MKPYTVQCGQAAYRFATVRVDGTSLEDALTRAMREADREGDWQMSRIRGPVFVNAVALGADAKIGNCATLDVPAAFTETPPPRVIVTLSHGLVRNIEIASGTVAVEVRDGDEIP